MTIEVMIIEDEPMVREIICEYVDKLGGFAVAAQAGSGDEALEMLYRRPVELMILDIHMPGMNGVEFLTRLRGSGNRSDVIFLTASNDTQMISAALNLGAADYLIKPFTYERFSLALENYRRRHDLLRQGGEATQQQLDSVFSAARPGGHSDHVFQKGVHPKTLESIRGFVAGQSVGLFSQQEAAETLGLSKVTVRKYLEYLVGLGELEQEIEYGPIGRPTHMYRKRE